MRRSMWNLAGVVTALVVGLGGFSVASAQEKPKQDKPTAKKHDKKDDKKTEKKHEKDLVEIAAGHKDLSILVELLKDAGLTETLKGEGPFTLFAPTNAAFEKLGKEKLAELKKDKAKLAAILKFHVHSGAALHDAELTKDKSKAVTTLNGQELTITTKDKDVHVGTAKMTKSDIKAKNGVIHLIDAVQMPKD